MKSFDVIVIGGGQSGLAVGYYLRRTGLSYVILDSEREPGGAWLHMWKSLRLFSPAQWSSLPGIIMPGGPDQYPTRSQAVDYLRSYEEKYHIPIRRRVVVNTVRRQGDLFIVQTSDGIYDARAVVSATGSFGNPNIPAFDGMEQFKGQIFHSSQYLSPDIFANKRVAVVGEGNSGAQILAEVSKVADTLWITLKEPGFLPDDVDGRFLFDAATQMYQAQKLGKQFKPPSLGDIVMVEPVKEARARGVLKSVRPFKRFAKASLVWEDGHEEKIDAVIFCTGFKPSLQHLEPLGIVNADGKASTIGTRSTAVHRLWLVGYGSWTGFASATLIGVGRSAKSTVDEIGKYITALRGAVAP